MLTSPTEQLTPLYRVDFQTETGILNFPMIYQKRYVILNDKMFNGTWTIDMAPEAEAEWKGSKLSKDDRIVISTWAKTVRDSGPEELQKHPGLWNDHSLTGFWDGCRASNFSNSGRIIYYRFDELGRVQILRISVDHNYTIEGKIKK